MTKPVESKQGIEPPESSVASAGPPQELVSIAGWWQSLALPPRYRRAAAAAEVILVASLILAYIWKIQFLFYHFPALILAFILIGIPLHADTPATLGLGARGLKAASRDALLVTALCAGALLALAYFSQRPVFNRSAEVMAGYLWRYFAWCLFQQFGLQSFINNRLLEALRGSHWAPVLAGLIFGAFHLPNPVLVPATALGGWLMAEIFRRHRNIIPLAAAQAIIGLLIALAFPPELVHNLRVGPGYWRPL